MGFADRLDMGGVGEVGEQEKEIRTLNFSLPPKLAKK